MGLYLCVFDDEEELEGVEVGSYTDFEYFRSTVTRLLEGGNAGVRYPTLIIHSDSDGAWSPAECERLRQELRSISEAFRQIDPVPYRAVWQQQVSKLLGLRPSSLYDVFIDVDGEPLLQRMLDVCDVAVQSNRPVLFQ
jgi:Immunity protein 70